MRKSGVRFQGSRFIKVVSYRVFHRGFRETGFQGGEFQGMFSVGVVFVGRLFSRGWRVFG